MKIEVTKTKSPEYNKPFSIVSPDRHWGNSFFKSADKTTIHDFIRSKISILIIMIIDDDYLFN